jgi:hypothetical protein
VLSRNFCAVWGAKAEIASTMYAIRRLLNMSKGLPLHQRASCAE